MHEDRPSIVIEEYLQEIYLLNSTSNPVKAVNLAKRLNTTPSTVHSTLSRMQRDDLIIINEKKHILLTEKGKKQARDLKFRHILAENFLCEALGIPWYEVHKHAHQLEHALTPLVVEKLADFLGNPVTCPHGTPIDKSELDDFEKSITLKKAQQGMKIKVLMVNELLEDSEELMKYLHGKNVIPGKLHHVIERLESTHSITLKSEDSQTTLPFDIAENIIVKEVP